MPTPAPVYEPGAKLPTPGAPGGYVTAGANGTAPSLPAAPVYKPQAGMTPSTPSGQPALPPTTTPVTPPAGGTTGAGGAQNPTPASIVTPGSPTDNPAAPSSAQVQGATNTLGQSTSDIQNAELSAEDYAVSRSSDLIKDVSDTYSDELSAAAQNAEGSEAAGGQGGGPVGASAEYTAMQPILNQQASAVATEIQNIQNNAASVFESAESDAQTDAEQTLANNQSAKTALLSSVANMAAVGYTPSQLQEQNPDEYDYLLNYGFNGDTNAMNTAFLFGTKSTLLNSGQPVYTNGTTQVYGQMTMNPDGTPAIKYTSIQLPYAAPSTWTQNKISTTTMMMQDPNNPANTLIYTTDPLSGQVNVTGTGTGAALASQYNSASGSSSDTTTPTQTSGAGTASTTVATILGVSDPTQPLSDIINGSGTTQGVGMGPLVSAIIKSEGSALPSTLNNPGDVKFNGLPGQTDSGIKAQDGGTFAAYATPEEGQQAIADTVQSALNGNDPNYGPNPTLQSFMDTYANQNGGSSPTTSNNTQYGLLSTVSGFDPGPSTGAKTHAQELDNAAFQYLQTYLKTGAVPTNTNVLGMRAGTDAELPNIAQRAEDLYSQATDQPLPDQTILDANKGFISGNNSLLNSLKVQESTIQANSDLMQGNINAENINQNAPIINNVIDGISNALGDPNVASYLAQNSTLSNELGSLLALKNASGTTVHDKLISADLISPDASAKQEAEVVNTLMKEAVNAHGAITMANAQLYLQNDPLGLDPQNPLSNPTQFASSVGLNLDAIQKDYSELTPTEIITQYINGQ